MQHRYVRGMREPRRAIERAKHFGRPGFERRVVGRLVEYVGVAVHTRRNRELLRCKYGHGRYL
jgi:hypothetical protein